VIHVAVAVSVHQRGVAGQCSGNTDLLRTPVEIDADRIGRKDHKRAHAGVGVVEAFAVCIAPGGGAKREQARPVSTIAADWQFGPHDDTEAIPERVQALDSGLFWGSGRRPSDAISRASYAKLCKYL
jgi:hypothetical protein